MDVDLPRSKPQLLVPRRGSRLAGERTLDPLQGRLGAAGAGGRGQDQGTGQADEQGQEEIRPGKAFSNVQELETWLESVES